MTKSRVFVLMMLGFAVGVFLASQFRIPMNWVYYSLALFAIGLGLAYRASDKRDKRHVGYQQNWRMVVALFLLCTSAGVWRENNYHRENEFAHVLNEKTQWDGIITADVDVRTDRQQLTFQPYGYHQNILIFTSKGKPYSYGDRIVVSGKVTVPKTSTDFDYASYLHRFNTYAIISYPKILTVQAEQGNAVTAVLLKMKYWFIARVNAILPETESSLLLGILIGARKTLPQEVIDNFNATGTSHIIAISGYNISIIISGLAFLVAYIGRRWNAWLTLIVVAAFVIMSGAGSSVMRAAVMGSLFLLASRVGRLYSLTPSLCLAATVMLIWNPYILYWDVSFQLSFLATAGIVYIVPPLESLTERWPSLFGVKTILITTFAAITATLPLILHSFGRLSLIAPVANIVILPIVPLTMLLGFLTALPLVGSGFGFLAHLLLNYILWMTSYLAHLPYASKDVFVSSGVAGGMYVVIVTGAFILNRWQSRVQRRVNLTDLKP